MIDKKEFLDSLLIDGAKREYNNLTSVINYKGLHLLNGGKPTNIYYIDGVNPEKEGRCSDSDIVLKKTIIFDLDVKKCRPGTGDEQIKGEFKDRLLAKLKSSGVFANINAIVYTGNGLHLYYTSLCAVECEGAGSLWSANYAKLAEKLEEVLGAKNLVDFSCKNLSRIFRLPGTWNDKVIDLEGKSSHSTNPEDYKLVEVLYWDSRVWNDEMLGGMFSSPNVETPAELLIDSNSWFTEVITPDMSRKNVIKRLNIKKALERLSGMPEVRGEKYQIWERKEGGWHIDVDQGDGKFRPCNAWLDYSGRIGSPNGGPYLTNWLAYFGGRTTKQIDDIIEKYFGHLLPRDRVDQIRNDEFEIENWTKEEFETKKIYFTWGLGKKADVTLPLLNKGQLVVLAGDAGVGKTTLASKLAEENAKDGHKIGFYSLEMPPRNVIMREVRKRIGISKEDRLNHNFANNVVLKSKEILAEIFKLGIFWPIFSGTPTVESICKLNDNNQYLDLVVVDNLSFIRSGKESEYDEQKEVVQQLLQSAQKNNICIILLHHFRKQSGQKDDGKRSAADLKGNNDIFNKADIVSALTKQKVEVDMGKGLTPEDNRKDVRFINYLNIFKDREDGELTKMQITYEQNGFKQTGS